MASLISIVVKSKSKAVKEVAIAWARTWDGNAEPHMNILQLINTKPSETYIEYIKKI